jgi:hypothetical protein
MFDWQLPAPGAMIPISTCLLTVIRQDGPFVGEFSWFSNSNLYHPTVSLDHPWLVIILPHQLSDTR